MYFGMRKMKEKEKKNEVINGKKVK